MSTNAEKRSDGGRSSSSEDHNEEEFGSSSDAQRRTATIAQEETVMFDGHIHEQKESSMQHRNSKLESINNAAAKLATQKEISFPNNRGYNSSNRQKDGSTLRHPALSGLEQDLLGKQKKISSNDVSVNTSPGAHAVTANNHTATTTNGSNRLTRLEQDLLAKQQEGPSISPSVPEQQLLMGQSQLNGQRQLSRLEQDLAAKHHGSSISSATSSGPSIPGAYPSSTPTKNNTGLTLLESDLLAKSKTSYSVGASLTASPTGAHYANSDSDPSCCSKGHNTSISQLEQDLEAKTRGRTYEMQEKTTNRDRPLRSSNEQLTQLETDMVAKNSSARCTANSLPSCPGAHPGEGAFYFGQFERDLQGKNSNVTSTGSIAAVTGANAKINVGNSQNTQLDNLENDIVAKSAGRLQAQAQAPACAGGKGLNTLEQDIIAKRQNSRTGVAVVPGATPAKNTQLDALELATLNDPETFQQSGYHPSSSKEQFIQFRENAQTGGQGMCSASPRGHSALSSLEQDLATKNRARPTPLLASSTGGTSQGCVSEDLIYLGDHDSRERSQLFTNIRHSQGQSIVNSISYFDERIAQKRGQPQQSQNGCNGQHREVAHGDDEYFDYSGGGSGDPFSKTGDKEEQDDGGQFDVMAQNRTNKDRETDSTDEGGVSGGFCPTQEADDMEYGYMEGNELAIATAIEEDEDDSFIPAAVQYDPDAKPPLYKNRRCRLYGLAGFCFVLLAAVAAVVITQVADNSSSTVYRPATTPAREAALELEDQLAKVFGRHYFQDPSSIHSKALDWLIDEDKFKIQPDAENLIQRFVLVFFYLETSQNGPWRSCNPATGNQKDFCYFQVLTGIDDNGSYLFNDLYSHRWLSSLHECHWAGVTCHSNMVTNIVIAAHEIGGTIPKELSKLEYLRSLSLGYNNFVGTIPTEILGIKHLTDFELNFNYLAGTIPPELFNSDDLILINLGGNSFTGSLPSEIGRVSVLQRLLLYSNQLSGSLPIELFQLESLKWMYIPNNLFSGTLRTEIGTMSGLEHLALSGNPLTGTLPTELGLLTKIKEIDVKATNLGGSIPEEMFVELCARMDEFDVSNRFDISSCQFEGTISTNIGLCTNMEWLLLYDNNLSGTIPSEVALMTNLARFDVSGNNLMGTMPDEICQLRGRLRDVVADCSTISSGETPVFCPSTCCTECCNQETGICLPTVS